MIVCPLDSPDFGDICALYSPFLHQLTMQSTLPEPGCLRPCPSYCRRRDRIDLGLLHSLYKGGGPAKRRVTRCHPSPPHPTVTGGSKLFVEPSSAVRVNHCLSQLMCCASFIMSFGLTEFLICLLFLHATEYGFAQQGSSETGHRGSPPPRKVWQAAVKVVWQGLDHL